MNVALILLAAGLYLLLVCALARLLRWRGGDV